MSSINVPVPMVVSSDSEAANMSIEQKLTTGTTFVINKAPYLFRASEAGDADVAAVEKIIGGTIAWNQLFKPDMTITYTGLTTTTPKTGTWRFNGTLSSAASGNIWIPTLLANHVYMMDNGRTDTKIALSNTQTLTISKSKYVFKVGAANKLVNIYMSAGTYTDDDFTPQVFDLTQMFGSTIADYIYALEQSNAGAGVAWFRKYFPKPYYEYNSGELLSVQTSAHKMVGFNQYDGALTIGKFWSNGTLVSRMGNKYAAAENKVRCIPNVAYCVSFPNAVKTQNRVYVTSFDADGNFLRMVYNDVTTASKYVFTTDSDCYMFAISFYTNSSTFADGDFNAFCINIHWDGERDGKFEPYVEHVYPLDDSLTLRGILKLDASNNLYADGDRYLPDGTVIRKRKRIVLDGSTKAALSVTLSGGTYYTVFSISDNKSVDSGGVNHRIITDKGYTETVAVSVGNIYVTNAGTFIVICLFDQTLTTTSAVDTYLSSNPITVEYELATPTIEAASPYQPTQIVDDFGTEEFVDAAVESGGRDVAIPVGNETKYVKRSSFVNNQNGYFEMVVVSNGVV